MKKILTILVLLSPLAAFGQSCPGTITPKLGLCIPNHGIPNWDMWINPNWTILDNAGGGGTPAPPAYAIQFANTSAASFQADQYIKINPTDHTVQLSNPASSGFATSIGSLSQQSASYSLDTTTKATFLNSINGSVTLYPEWFGAQGNGIHDDTAAVQAAFAALPTTGGTVQFNGKQYLITGMIDTASLVSTTQGNYRNTRGVGKATQILCHPTSSIAACFRIMNGSDSAIEDMDIQQNSNVTQAAVVVTVGIANSSQRVKLSNLHITGGVHGVWLGPDNTGDVAEVNLYNVQVAGTSAEGFVAGNGSAGNTLDNFCFGCVADSDAGALLINGGGLSWIGGGVSENSAVDFHMTRPPSQQIVIEGVRSENSPAFWAADTGTSAAVGGVTLQDDSWAWAGGSNTPTTYVVTHNDSVPLTINNSRFSSTNNTVDFNVGYGIAGHPTPFMMHNVGTSNAAFGKRLAALAASPYVTLFSSGDYYINPSTDGLSAGSGITYASGSFNAGNNIQVGNNLIVAGFMYSALAGFGPYANYAIDSLFSGTSTYWGFSTDTHAVLTANQNTDVFGNMTAEKSVCTAIASGTCSQQQTTGLTMLSGHTYKLSIYMQGTTGAEVVTTRLHNGDANCEPGGGTFPGSWTLTTGLVLYSAVCTPTTNETAIPDITDFAGGVSGGTDTIYLSQAQVCEVGVNCGPQVITTTVPLTGSGSVLNGVLFKSFKGTTGTITGTSLSATCDSGTASVTGAVVGQTVSVSSTTGADVGGAFNVRGSVTSTGVVTVYVCGTGTPSSLAYNVVVQ